MIAKGHLGKGVPGDGVGVFRIRHQPGNDLCPHPFQRILVETRLHQGCAQQGKRLVAVLAQELGRHGYGIVACAIAERGSKLFLAAGKLTRVQIARALFEQGGHQVRRAALAGFIQRGTAAKAQLKRGEGDGMFLDQPCGDALFRGDFLNVDLGPCGDGDDQQDQRDKKTFHWVTSVSRINHPVTEDSSRNRSRAACMMSSAVTA